MAGLSVHHLKLTNLGIEMLWCMLSRLHIDRYPKRLPELCSSFFTYIYNIKGYIGKHHSSSPG